MDCKDCLYWDSKGHIEGWGDCHKATEFTMFDNNVHFKADFGCKKWEPKKEDWEIAFEDWRVGLCSYSCRHCSVKVHEDIEKELFQAGYEAGKASE